MVIWDGMQEAREYRSFNQFLRSRGRRSVLVGSCYQTDVAGKELPNSVRVSPAMDNEEGRQFQIFLGSIDSDLPARFVRLKGDELRHIPRLFIPLFTGNAICNTGRTGT